MATRPIIDIQVNSAEFEKFNALFNDFTAKLDQQPQAWSKLNAALGGASDATGALSEGALTAKEAIALAGAQAAIVAEALTQAVKAQNSLEDASHGTNKKMSELAKTAKNLGSEIAGIGKWVLRLGSGALAGLGLGTLAGGFGLTELANKAYARSRSAEGLGLSPGQLASFSVNAQPFLDEGALHSAAAAQTTYQSAPYLQMLGIDFNRAQMMNAADLAFAELKGAVQNWQNAQKAGTPPAASPLVQAYEELGGSLEDVRRAVRLGLPAVNAAQAGYRRDVGVLGFDRQTAAAWTNFHKQLDRAGFEIETVFINKLGPLVPEFTQLSKDVINAVAGFVKSKDFGALMGRLQDGLHAFVTWVEGPDPKKLWAGLSLVGSEVMAVADKLKWLLPSTQAAALPPEPGHKEAGFGKVGSMEYDASNAVWVDKSTGTTYDPMSGAWTDKKGSVYDPKTKTWQPTLLSKIAGFPDWLNANADKSGDWGLLGQGVSALQHMIMGTIAGQESKGRGDTNAVNKDSGALGLYQFMPATADEYLGTSWTKKYGSTTTAAGRANFLGSPAAQERAALAYLMDLEKVAAAKHFKGADFIRAIAEGWYGGPGAVGNPNVSGGAGYPTTGQYSTKVLERLLKALIQKQQHGTKVSISNSTSARVAVSANAIATG